MPIYEYVCLKCGEQFEDLIRNKADEEALRCPVCNTKKVQKQMSAFGVQGAVEKPVSAGSSGCASCTASSCSSCR